MDFGSRRGVRSVSACSVGPVVSPEGWLTGGERRIGGVSGISESSAASRRLYENSIIWVYMSPMRRLGQDDMGEALLTAASDTTTTNPKILKYTTNPLLLNSSSKSSKLLVGSGTIPKTAMSTAPAAMKIVPRIIHGEKTSPRRRRAKNAFQRRDTAPNGARMTTGREAIWTREPRILEDKNIASQG